MKVLFIGLAIVHVVAFCYMWYSRHRSRGTIAFHRHPHDVRRKRKEAVEIVDTMEIIRMVNSSESIKR